ncbi:MAG: chromosome partitioning protein, partial [Spirochaetaceae bacterium]|nr:chromosome partitioning protein [Spirochaetaceae bacterium]
ILGFITTQKLHEKKILALKTEQEKWTNRVELARNSGAAELEDKAAAACRDIENQIQSVEAENSELKAHIKSMIGRLPGLAARERSVDPDVLEQELLLAAGFTPGQETRPASPDDKAYYDC